MKILNFSIGNKLAFLVLLSVLPALLILLYTGMEQRRHSLQMAEDDVQLLAHSLAEAQQAIAVSVRQTLSTLAQTPAVQRLDARASSALFKAVAAKNPEYLGLTLTDPAGQVLASNRLVTGINLADRKHIRDTVSAKKFSVGEYIVTREGLNTPVFPYSYPVLDQKGNIRGVLTAILRLNRLAGFFDVSRLPANSFVAVTDHQGIRLFYHPVKKETNPIGKPIRRENWDIARKSMTPGQFIDQGSDGIRRIFAFEQVRLAPENAPYMYVWAAIPEATILKPANGALARNLLLMLLCTGLALGISWLLGKRTLLAPIQSLVATTRDFALGRLDARSELAAKPDELGTLARAFNEMADSLAKSQAMLREREAHLEEAQRMAHIGSWEWEAAADTPVWSKELARILEIDPAGPTPSLAELARLFTPESARGMEAALARTRQTGEPYELELEWKRPDDARRWILARGEARRDARGTITGLRGTALDITERKQAEEERERLRGQLGQAQKMESIGRLAGGVAHDFNNMLSVILGHTEMALDKLGPTDPLHDELQAIAKAGRRSADLIRQLLAFARKQIVAPQVLDLNETVEGILKMLRRLIGEAIELAWLPAVSLWRIRMDPSQIDQILANFCVNARDAIAGVGTITLKTENVIIDHAFCGTHNDCVPGEYVLLSVRDTGSGMDQETQANLFEPFFTTKELGKGTGLGLATVYGIVRQNKGFITVESAPGQGATFRIFLPRFHGEATATESRPEKELPLGSGQTVLLVEDEPMVMNLGRSLLSDLGYKVLSAATPGEAIRLAAEHGDDIRLLITDVIMPEMNGGELAARLRADGSGLKCLFISGYPADVIAHQGILDKGVLFIPKPFVKRELAFKVHEALTRN
ncbi:ATP-binding protein [Thiovibrio sp. JS02]